MKLVRVTTDDLLWAAVVQMDQDCLKYPWSLQQWMDLSLNDRVYAWVKEDELQGFALLRTSLPESLVHLLKIAVRAELRGHGVSNVLFRSIEDAMRRESFERIYLEVETANEQALGFYRRLNFQKLRRVTGFYRDGSDAWTMEKLI